ncbi:MAG TPA: hypothetical protein PLO65_12810 [Caulobacter sp.]|nr:hypothetical protein [Caulobacter sp.]
MSEEPGFTPNSPLTRKPRKRSWLAAWVLLALVAGMALIVLVGQRAPAAAWRAAGVAYGVLLAFMAVRQVWLVRRDLRSRRFRDQWFGRMLDRSSLDDS